MPEAFIAPAGGKRNGSLCGRHPVELAEDGPADDVRGRGMANVTIVERL